MGQLRINQILCKTTMPLQSFKNDVDFDFKTSEELRIAVKEINR